jgi:predicted DNA-binding transcriptional regulator YafY
MRADRLISLLMLLQTQGRMTARELAEALEVSERTIYRDMDALSAAGVPVYAERGPGGGCALLDSYRTNLTGLTQDEVCALFMLSVPSPLADLGVSEELKAALLKLAAALPSAHRRDAEHGQQRIHLDAAGWFQPEEPVPHLRTIQAAVWQDRKLHIKYRRGDGTPGERTVAPYGLVAKASIWYLVASRDGQMRVYRVSRVQKARLTDEYFERPAGFDLATFWDQWCKAFETSRPQYPVTLRVAPDFLPVLPQIFGEGIHTLIAHAGPPDDRGRVTLTLTFECLEAARSQVLGLGTQVEVIAPPALRESVLETATRVVAFYAATGDRTAERKTHGKDDGIR